MPSPSSSARQALEALGGQLRELRLEAGLTGRDLGRLAGWHSSKVSKLSTAAADTDQRGHRGLV
jgi:helix-turn-helix protein